MNLSGHAVTSFLSYFIGDLQADLANRLLVVYDDMDLPEGRLRFRSNGTSGGHKGLQSVLTQLGRPQFSRLRVGIGRQSNKDVKDYVLEKIAGESLEVMDRAILRSAEGLSLWLQEGVESCMNRFNESED